MNQPEPFVTIEALAKHFAVSISTIRAWIRQGHIASNTYIKVGTTYRFQISKVSEALLEARGEETTEEETLQKRHFPQQPLEEGDEELQLEFDFTADDDI